MKSLATEKFWDSFNALTPTIQDLARKNFALWRENPSHPSLHFKQVGKLWSVRVGIHHRALAIKSEDTFVWFWIGNHKDYERIVRS